MKRLATVFALSATVLLSGCGGVPKPAPIISTPSATPATTTIANFAGNWLFSTASNVPGKPPLTFAGSVSQANSAVSSALHVDGSSCFNQLTTMGLTGTVTAGSSSLTSGSTSLTSTALNAQVVTFTGKFIVTYPDPNFPDATFTGTYSIGGGCAGGDQGSVTGSTFSVLNALDGTFTSSAQKTFNITGGIAQSVSASSEGSFQITGDVTFDTSCFSAGTVNPGSFPSGSFILGATVAVEFDTGNGIVTFVGTMNQDGTVISGNYTVSGGTCADNGTAVLHLSDPWAY